MDGGAAGLDIARQSGIEDCLMFGNDGAEIAAAEVPFLRDHLLTELGVDILVYVAQHRRSTDQITYAHELTALFGNNDDIGAAPVFLVGLGTYSGSCG